MAGPATGAGDATVPRAQPLDVQAREMSLKQSLPEISLPPDAAGRDSFFWSSSEAIPPVA
jgi:hypothetical protein